MIAALLLGTITCIAQVKYYSTTKTFNQCGYTYQCDVKYQEVTLYNKANKRTYTNQIFKATGKEPPLFNNPDDVLDDNTLFHMFVLCKITNSASIYVAIL
ncbi:MAG: DUF5043 domain-containing protein [Bacteroides sp.]